MPFTCHSRWTASKTFDSASWWMVPCLKWTRYVIKQFIEGRPTYSPNLFVPWRTKSLLASPELAPSFRYSSILHLVGDQRTSSDRSRYEHLGVLATHRRVRFGANDGRQES